MRDKKAVTRRETHRGVQASDTDTSRCRSYAREIPRSPQEKREFNNLRDSLFEQYSPTTPLQNIAIKHVFCLAWRLRVEVEAELSSEALGTLDTSKSDADSMSGFYADNQQTVRQGIKFLSCVRQDFISNGILREEWKESLCKGFGEELFESLAKWNPGSRDRILMADMLARHAETFRRPLPDIEKESATTVILDPYQSTQMVTKLIDQEIRHMQAVLQMSDRKAKAWLGGPNSDAAWGPPSKVTPVMQKLQSALQFFVWLKKNRL